MTASSKGSVIGVIVFLVLGLSASVAIACQSLELATMLVLCMMLFGTIVCANAEDVK